MKNLKIHIITAVLAAGILTMLFLSGGCKKEPELKSCNVVLIVIDTLRSDHLPFHGYPTDTAPFLTELSKKALLFDNAFSGSSWTSPGTASIFTSLYPYQHGCLMGLLAIRNAQRVDPDITVNRIPEEVETVAEVMKKAGYKTYGVSDNLNIGERQGFTQGFDKFRTFMYNQAPAVNNTIKKWRQEMEGEGKYFLYIQYMDPHAPYHPRPPLYQADPDPQKERISAYDSEIRFVDTHLQELYTLFKWDQNTLLIITSDHGEGLWDHGFMGHGKTLHREEIQVPLLILTPGASTGQRFTLNVSTLDILPTIRHYIGLPKSETDEGLSLLPLTEGDKEKIAQLESRSIFSYLWVKAEGVVEWKATLYKNWHSILRMPQLHYLFSLITDKPQKDNKYEQGKKIATELEARFETHMKTSRKYEQKSSDVKLNKKETDKLKSLGYVH